MSDLPEEIISDEEVARVHGRANFGTMTPREVLSDGVWKYSMGYSGGSTQLAILREHGLVTNRRGISYHADLTVKGKAYLRSLNPPPPDAWNTRAPSPWQGIETDCRKWWHYPIPMPTTVDGKGPATIGVDAATMAYEVWDRLLFSHASFDNLPDAINEAMRLNAAPPADGGEG